MSEHEQRGAEFVSRVTGGIAPGLTAIAEAMAHNDEALDYGFAKQPSAAEEQRFGQIATVKEFPNGISSVDETITSPQDVLVLGMTDGETPRTVIFMHAPKDLQHWPAEAGTPGPFVMIVESFTAEGAKYIYRYLDAENLPGAIRTEDSKTPVVAGSNPNINVSLRGSARRSPLDVKGRVFSMRRLTRKAPPGTGEIPLAPLG